mmetsp:Transcript_31935/g.67211  ORF Transcript_31935/g.67211 Transcript_31935/m.67211 type:complete len:344 (-) Transcript_31935:1273-2304(-)
MALILQQFPPGFCPAKGILRVTAATLAAFGFIDASYRTKSWFVTPSLSSLSEALLGSLSDADIAPSCHRWTSGADARRRGSAFAIERPPQSFFLVEAATAELRRRGVGRFSRGQTRLVSDAACAAWQTWPPSLAPRAETCVFGGAAVSPTLRKQFARQVLSVTAHTPGLLAASRGAQRVFTPSRRSRPASSGAIAAATVAATVGWGSAAVRLVIAARSSAARRASDCSALAGCASSARAWPSTASFASLSGARSLSRSRATSARKACTSDPNSTSDCWHCAALCRASSRSFSSAAALSKDAVACARASASCERRPAAIAPLSASARCISETSASSSWTLPSGG